MTTSASRRETLCDGVVARATHAATWLTERGVTEPVGAMILGSGWAPLVERMTVVSRWSYARIPGLPACTVSGHPGELVYARWGGVPLVVFAGRWHLYEGHTRAELAMAPLVAKALGAQWLLTTNAAGGIDAHFRVGDLVAVTDDLSYWAGGYSPYHELAHGHARRPCGPRYSPRLIGALRAAARETGISLHSGVLAMVNGANYETAAEIAMLRFAGASLVGMSTQPEIHAAHVIGLGAAALSCVTNRVPSAFYTRLDHADVLGVLERSRGRAERLIEVWLQNIDSQLYDL